MLSHDFQKRTAAWKVDRLSVDQSPLIHGPDALRTKLSAQPIDIFHQGNSFHPHPRGLNGCGTSGLISTADEQIDVHCVLARIGWDRQQTAIASRAKNREFVDVIFLLTGNRAEASEPGICYFWTI